MHGVIVMEVCVQVVKNNLSPTWKKFTVPLQTFCSSDLDRPLKVLTNQITPSFKTTSKGFGAHLKSPPSAGRLL